MTKYFQPKIAILETSENDEQLELNLKVQERFTQSYEGAVKDNKWFKEPAGGWKVEFKEDRYIITHNMGKSSYSLNISLTESGTFTIENMGFSSFEIVTKTPKNFLFSVSVTL